MYVMKKNLLFLTVMIVYAGAFSVCAQTVPFKVRFSVTAATCYNNGKVAYALTDVSDNPLSALPAGVSQVRAYYKASETDSAHYSGLYYHGGIDTLTLNHGIYIVGVEALWPDGAGGYMRADTHTVLTVNTVYQKPEAAVLTSLSYYESHAGTRPTVACEDAGRLQLRIRDGQFPYTVVLKPRDSEEVFRTVVFRERQYDGNMTEYYNYKDYYTLDSLPAGEWDLYVEDGCGYGLPRIRCEVPLMDFPKVQYFRQFTSSGNFTDSNVVKLEMTLNDVYSYQYDMLPKHVRYRLRCDGIAPTSWKPFPIDEISSTKYFTVRDTFHAVSRYCALWDKDITFEYKISECEDTVQSIVFRLQRPNDEYFEKDYSDFRDSIVWRGGTCIDKWFWHRYFHGIRYYTTRFEKGSYAPFYSTSSLHQYYRYYYTHPLSWVYTDVATGSVIKRDTVGVITDWSRLYDRDVERVYGSFRETPLNILVERKLVDSKGCVLYSARDSLTYLYSVGTEVSDWNMIKSGSEKCCKDLRYVKVFEHHRSEADPDGTVIRLVRSPNGDFYNFEAVYSSDSRSWTVTRDRLENTAGVLGAPDGRSLLFQDYCLPSGPYTFEIVTPCSTFVLSQNYNFGTNVRTVLSQAPQFQVEEECSGTYLTYTDGAFQTYFYGNSVETGLPDDPLVYDRIAMFQIYSGPVGSDRSRHRLGEPFHFTIPGTYVVGMYPESPNSVCFTETLYDTVHYDGNTVEFVYANALLCDSNSTHGDAYVAATNGTPPYTYTLYSQREKQGAVLGVNGTGRFLNIPMQADRELSCLVQDSCGAYFHVNFYPRLLGEMQKVWFDGGLTADTVCEGGTLRVHAMSIGDILRYEWRGPGGFSATTADPYVFVPRGAPGGWYSVVIRNTGCVGYITDSLYLGVMESPRVAIAPNATVCPGDTVALQFTPWSPVPGSMVDFTVSIVTENGTTRRNYSALSGTTVTDRYVARAAAKVFAEKVSDGRCEYRSADPSDTVRIGLRTDFADACTLLTTDDLVCYGGTARLTARSTLTPPYDIRWYGDYAMTQLLKMETIVAENAVSVYDTAGITQRTALFVSVGRDSVCPSFNGMVTDTMHLRPGRTQLSCGRVVGLYDSGGDQGKFGFNEDVVHTFSTSDGRPVCIHFESFKLPSSAHLFVVSGEELSADSLLCDLTANSLNPGVLTSVGGTLTVYFRSFTAVTDGWAAVVEPSPGIAVADAFRRKGIELRDEVCQSRTRAYDDPYGMVPEVVSAAEIDAAMRHAGVYGFTKNFPGSDGCDSTVTFILTVTAPPHRDTAVVVADGSVPNVLWHDSVYSEPGRHVWATELPGGCDSIEVLDIVKLDMSASSAEICSGDSAELVVTVSTASGVSDATLPRMVQVGDVLCADGSVLPPDAFMVSGKQPKGVVFHVDSTGFHGLALALSEQTALYASREMERWTFVRSQSLGQALFDMDGLGGTLLIKTVAETTGCRDFFVNAPCASYCYYYDHERYGVGPEPKGWYLPALGELNLMCANSRQVMPTLQMLKSLDNRVQHFKGMLYTSSSCQDDTRAWFVDNSSTIYAGSFYGSNNTSARAVTTF